MEVAGVSSRLPERRGLRTSQAGLRAPGRVKPWLITMGCTRFRKSRVFMWIDSVGAQTVVDKLERLRDEHQCARFAPCQLLIDHAKAGKPFHP